MKIARDAAVALLLLSTWETAAPAGQLSLSALSATRNRPLFSPTRRPLPPPPKIALAPAPAPVVAPAPPPQIELTGVVFGSAEPFALVKKSGENSSTSVVIGSKIDGWRVTSISDQSIILSDGKRTTSVRLNRRLPGDNRIQIIETPPLRGNGA